MIYLSADSCIWLVTRDSKVHFTPAQLFILLWGINWKLPERTALLQTQQNTIYQIILEVFRSEGKLLTDRPVKTVETEKLKEFSDRNQFARKKTDPRKRLVVYEFSRISNEVQLEIDEAIKNILRKLPE